jgi:integrase
VVTALRTNRDRAILGLMWALGLRIGEVLALRWEDLDWEHATVQVRGKGDRERNLPLPLPVAVLIRRYHSVEWPRGAGPTVFVVLKGPRRGQALTYAAARRIFRYHRDRLNLPEAHPHRFRHTFAANMIRQGMSVPSLMRLMGHTWAQTTLRYVHFDDAEVREHYEKALQKLAQTGAVSAADVCAVL